MPRVIIEPAYYTGVPVMTFLEGRREDSTTHPSFDAAIAYWQCEYGFGNAKLLDRAHGRYVVAFEVGSVDDDEKTRKNTESP